MPLLRWFHFNFFFVLHLDICVYSCEVEITKDRLWFKFGLVWILLLWDVSEIFVPESPKLFWKAWHRAYINSRRIFRTCSLVDGQLPTSGNKSKTQNNPEGTPSLNSFEQTRLLRISWNSKTAAWQNTQVPWHWYEEISHFGYTVLPNTVLQSILSDATSVSIPSL